MPPAVSALFADAGGAVTIADLNCMANLEVSVCGI